MILESEALIFDLYIKWGMEFQRTPNQVILMLNLLCRQ